jgi:predicted metalloprotease with PDZ domain
MRCLTPIVVALIAACAHADIDYLLAPNIETSRLQVQMTFETNGALVELKLPRWAPGSYRLFNPSIEGVTAKRGSTEISVTKLDDNTWRIDPASAGQISVSYTAPIRLNQMAVHVTGPQNYLYVAGRKDENCKLRVDLPAGWRAINGLDEGGGGWTAPSYDVLADNPTTMGVYLLDTYYVQKKPHYIVLYGSGATYVDRQDLMKYCESVTRAEASFFGEIPYNKYVWHFAVNNNLDGAGGLEHLSSTSISLAAGVGPSTVRVLAHEFFHLWNVKRIRSKPLGPFDYQNLPKTGALWWLEGVTDYYASLLTHRYSILSENDFYQDVIRNFREYDGHAQKNNVSPNESSMRVGETNNGRGNSNGYLISYYTMGWLSGLCLDIEIRRLTANKKSLDDVMRALYAISGHGKPGFEEGEIRKQCIRIGGPEMGPFYDLVVKTNGSIPVRESLAKLGLEIVRQDERFVNLDISFQGAAEYIEIRRDFGDLKRGMRVAAIGGQSLEGLNPIQSAKKAKRILDAAAAGEPLEFGLAGEGQTVTIVPELKVREMAVVRKIQNAAQDAIALRNALLVRMGVPEMK